MAKCEKSDGLMQVAVVDDSESTCLCLKDILQSAENFSFAGSFSNATEALVGIPRLRPDLTLMDVQLPDLNGIECTKRLKKLLPNLKVVIITGTHKINWVDASLQAGAIAYLFKPFVEDQLLATLKFAAITEDEAKSASKPEHRLITTKRAEANVHLSPRENEVLKNLADGLLYKEISDKLGISYTTVHKYQHSIFIKLHVSNRSEAIRVWFQRLNS